MTDVVDDVAQALEFLDGELRPGDVVLVKASRSVDLQRVAEASACRCVDRERSRPVKGILAAGTISLIVSLFGTPFAIRLLRSRGYGQLIRDDGPTTHHTKRGTPTMGGAVILLAGDPRLRGRQPA